jgi:hypothetical protein
VYPSAFVLDFPRVQTSALILPPSNASASNLRVQFDLQAKPLLTATKGVARGPISAAVSAFRVVREALACAASRGRPCSSAG